MKRTWQVISETLNRNKRKHDMPSLFTHEGRDLVDSTEIANAFNTYFANIGKNLSSQIDQNNVIADYKQYLTSPTRETLKFECITKDYTIKAIDNLENKNSSGHDGISNQGWGQVQLTKYSSTPSTPNIYQVQVLVKYSFF